MAKYRKKAIMVTAYIADQDQYVTTLEGVSEAKKGDYIVTGIDNEQWAVKPKWFNGAYTHIKDDKYQRKPQVLEATQIDSPDTVHAPTGDIKGDPGDYKVTGTKGEQWFVKPDIFDKTYEKVGKSMTNNTKTQLQKAIDQIGMEAVQKSITHAGISIGFCDLHGHYGFTTDKTCPLCPSANGQTATEVEHFINIKEAIDPTAGINPGQKANPTAISDRDIERAHEDSEGYRIPKD